MQTITLTNAERLQLPSALPDAGSLEERKKRKRLLAKIKPLTEEEREEAGFVHLLKAPPAKGEDQPRQVLLPEGKRLEDLDLPEDISPQSLQPDKTHWQKEVPLEIEVTEDEVELLQRYLDLLDEPDAEGNRASEGFGAWLVDFSMKLDEIAEA